MSEYRNVECGGRGCGVSGFVVIGYGVLVNLVMRAFISDSNRRVCLGLLFTFLLTRSHNPVMFKSLAGPGNRYPRQAVGYRQAGLRSGEGHHF